MLSRAADAAAARRCRHHVRPVAAAAALRDLLAASPAFTFLQNAAYAFPASAADVLPRLCADSRYA